MSFLNGRPRSFVRFFANLRTLWRTIYRLNAVVYQNWQIWRWSLGWNRNFNDSSLPDILISILPVFQPNMWTSPFVKNLKNTEYYLLKNSMKYQKMKLLMQGHWPTCEPHHLSTRTRQHWLASHNYSPRWWVFLSFIFCIIIIDLVPLSFIFCRIYIVHLLYLLTYFQ